MSKKYQFLYSSDSSCRVSNTLEQRQKHSDDEMCVNQQERDRIDKVNDVIDSEQVLHINKSNLVKRISCEDISRQDTLRKRRKSSDDEDKCK
jgi:hypothetical protein